MKLNLGCGNNYLEGWTNLDVSKEVKADFYHNLNNFPWPFKDNSFNEIFMDNVLEHLPDTISVMEEIHRVCKKNAIVDIIVPLAPTMFAFRDPTHVSFFTFRSMDYFTDDNTLNFYSNARFKIIERKIRFHHKLRFLNPLINIHPSFTKFTSEFFSQLFPPAFIEFKLEVLKNNG